MNKRETREEYRARLARFEAAKAEHEFYDTGLGRLLPDARSRMAAANAKMWEFANAPARDEVRQ